MVVVAVSRFFYTPQPTLGIRLALFFITFPKSSPSAVIGDKWRHSGGNVFVSDALGEFPMQTQLLADGRRNIMTHLGGVHRRFDPGRVSAWLGRHLPSGLRLKLRWQEGDARHDRAGGSECRTPRFVCLSRIGCTRRCEDRHHRQHISTGRGTKKKKISKKYYAATRELKHISAFLDTRVGEMRATFSCVRSGDNPSDGLPRVAAVTATDLAKGSGRRSFSGGGPERKKKRVTLQVDLIALSSFLFSFEP